MSSAVIPAASGISAFGAYQSGAMTNKSLQTQAQNLEAQGAEAEQKGQYDSMRLQIIAGQKIGATQAGYGASGVKANSGSVLDVVQASRQNAEADRLNILHGADIRAINYQNQASMDRFGGTSAALGADFQAIGQIASGAIKARALNTSAKPDVAGEKPNPAFVAAANNIDRYSSDQNAGMAGGADYGDVS